MLIYDEKKVTENQMWDAHAGFMKGKSCID